MLKRLATELIIALLVIGCSSPGATPTASPITTPTAGAATASPIETGTPAAIDQAFIDMMVPHHESAIAMAQLARDRAKHDELVSLADAIIAAQTREIGELKAWRLAWFGSDETPPMDAMPIMPGVDMPGMGHGMDGETMDMTADVEMLRTADPFDRAFMEAMIRHHQSAISAAQVILTQTDMSEIRSLAEDIIESQQAEITQLEEWLADWYPEAS